MLTVPDPNVRDSRNKVIQFLKRHRPDFRRRKYARLADYDIAGYDRIYHIHIRKTGGTSLNQMFLALGGDNTRAAFEHMASAGDHRIVLSDKVYVGWLIHLIEQGNYFYAFSHEPLHMLQLPPRTFRVTCFRDPVLRLFSHYSMVRSYVEDGIDHPCVRTEGHWLGESFSDFQDRAPTEHVLNQMYMFSKSLDEEEAFDRIAECEHVMFTEQFDEGVAELEQKIGFDLEPLHRNKTARRYDLTEEDQRRARELLEPEYRLLERVRELFDE